MAMGDIEAEPQILHNNKTGPKEGFR